MNMNTVPTPRPRTLRLHKVGAAMALGALLTYSLSTLSQPQDRQAWPQVPLPASAAIQAFDVGEQIEVNGVPMRITGFVSTESLPTLQTWFEAQLGPQQVSTLRGQTRILGTAQGDHFITVQLEPLPAPAGGSRGLIAITHRRQALQQRHLTQQALQQWQERLPSGTRVLQQTSAHEHGQWSRHLVAINNDPVELNVSHLIRWLTEQGYQLERDIPASVTGRAQLPAGVTDGHTLLFRGPDREAMAVLATDTQGRTTLVLNTRTRMETYP